MKHLEEQHQQALIQWAHLTLVQELGGKNQCTLSEYLIANANGGYRRPREAKRLISLGVTPGVSDLFLAYPVKRWHGFWIELKKPAIEFRSASEIRRAVSPQQTAWMNRMIDANYRTGVAYGWLEARDMIVNYLKLSKFRLEHNS